MSHVLFPGIAHELWPMVSLETDDAFIEPCPGIYWCRACYFEKVGKVPGRALRFHTGSALFAPPVQDHIVFSHHI